MKFQKGYYKGVKVDSKEYWNYQYFNYMNARNKIKNKGYYLKEALNKDDFIEAYKINKKMGHKNIIYDMAKSDKAVSFKVAKQIYEKEFDEQLEPYNLRKANVNKRFKDIIGLEFVNNKFDTYKKKYEDRYHKKWDTSINAKAYTYFSYMAELGLREEAEEEYGYK